MPEIFLMVFNSKKLDCDDHSSVWSAISQEEGGEKVKKSN